ncbi:MAG: hypothetical protein Ct9H300mP23_07650 [Nitrospinota bacterium]|nr:MAG: hypothetical protein Ct9H300mP23_07650 [Nitrospinota bacterium]
MTLFWSWFADFLAPVLTFPGVTLGKGAVSMAFLFGLWFLLAWQWQGGSMHIQHRCVLKIRSPEQKGKAVAGMSCFGIKVF